MIQQLCWRLMQALLVVLAVGLLTWFLVQALPGDMAWRIASGRYGYDRVDAEAVARVQQELGGVLDQSGALLHWLTDLLQFNFGRSLVSGEPVMDELRWQLSQTLALAGGSLLLALMLTLPIGLWAGCHADGKLDRLLFWLTSLLKSIPHFALGMILIVVFALQLDWLPSAGHGELRHFLLPALTLALSLTAVGVRVVREATCQVINAGYYQWGAQKGLTPATLLRRHGLRNLGTPVLTWFGMQFVWLVEGVVVVETLFAWPGIGHALVHAIFARDVPVIQASAMTLGLLFVLLNMLVDAGCHLLDPRGTRA
ncbi:ABC transporter permease [Pantoea rodasii]|uniref:ABC transporter permease n=1 Tax=Pantoea rodasii TaxID=1076549 RepID=A0A2M9WHV6_9GAMM|nr:ABC transporter permease [Pantoea rodasii]ORM62270.1 ABC transporter permease [Pantoea rodasii]PJZ07086.1 ABC transporter permease [Pantoea rodasii]